MGVFICRIKHKTATGKNAIDWNDMFNEKADIFQTKKAKRMAGNTTVILEKMFYVNQYL